MATFPTLSKKFSINANFVPNAQVHSNRYAGGFKVTRALNNRVLDTIGLEVVNATKADLTLINTFYKTTTKGSSAIFTITNPITNTSINARFIEGSLKIKPINNHSYNISFEIEEA